MNDNISKKDEIWMKKALASAGKALENGEFPVACILVSEGRIVGRGDRINSTGTVPNELDHAEILALRDWIERGRPGGVFTAYTTLEPCLMCLGALILNGAGRIVYSYEDVMGGSAGMNFSLPFSRGHGDIQADHMRHLYENFGDRIKGSLLRSESLELFKQFFFNPENRYLRGTILESYTLSQK